MGETYETLSESIDSLSVYFKRRVALTTERDVLLAKIAGIEVGLSDVEEQIDDLSGAIGERFGNYCSPQLIQEQIKLQEEPIRPEATPEYFRGFLIADMERNDLINKATTEDLEKVQVMEIHPRALIMNTQTYETNEDEGRFFVNMLLNNRLGVTARHILGNRVYRDRFVSETQARNKFYGYLRDMKTDPFWTDILQSGSGGKSKHKHYYIRHDVVLRPKPGAISYVE